MTGFQHIWPFWLSGAGIGLLIVLLAWIAGKAIGVSSGYASLCATVSALPYFQKKSFTEKWRLWFVAGIPIGAFLSAALAGDLTLKMQIGLFEGVFGGSLATKALVLGLGGFLVGYGARWAGG